MTQTHLVTGCILSAIAGCGVDHPVTTFVGPTSDPDIFLAVATDDTSTAAYLCDGDPAAGMPDAAPNVAVWLTGATASADSIDLVADDVALHATFGPAAASGTIMVAGAALTFDLGSPTTGDAGFYLADDTVDGARVLGSWIVLPDGRQRGAVRIEGGGGIGFKIGPVLSPKTRAITLSGIGTLPITRFDPCQLEGGAGVGRTPGGIQ